MVENGIGASPRRKEDYRFLTGAGTYTDDINRPGQLYAHILRSPHAAAKITSIDTAAAKAAPGVVAVYTGADVAKDGAGGLAVGGPPKGTAGRGSSRPTRSWSAIGSATSVTRSPWSSPRRRPRRPPRPTSSTSATSRWPPR